MKKRKKIINAPAVHIPVEQQATPSLNRNRMPVVHTGDDDFQPLEPTTPEVAKEVAHLEKERPTLASPEQHIEQELMMYEKNLSDERTRSQRWAGQSRWQGRENEEMRLVNILHPHGFIARLKRAGVSAALDNEPLNEWMRQMNAVYGPGNYPIMGNCGARIWLNSFHRLGRIGVNAWMKPELGTKAYERGVFLAKTITTLQYPYGPEWSIMRFNEYDVPTNEKFRGWRTALLTMIIAGVLTEAEAHEAFGPAMGQASAFYRQQMCQHRVLAMGISNGNQLAAV